MPAAETQNMDVHFRGRAEASNRAAPLPVIDQRTRHRAGWTVVRTRQRAFDRASKLFQRQSKPGPADESNPDFAALLYVCAGAAQEPPC